MERMGIFYNKQSETNKTKTSAQKCRPRCVCCRVHSECLPCRGMVRSSLHDQSTVCLQPNIVCMQSQTRHLLQLPTRCVQLWHCGQRCGQRWHMRGRMHAAHKTHIYHKAHTPTTPIAQKPAAPSTTSSEPEPIWVQREKARERAQQGGELPFGVYLLGSVIVAIASVWI